MIYHDSTRACAFFFFNFFTQKSHLHYDRKIHCRIKKKLIRSYSSYFVEPREMDQLDVGFRDLSSFFHMEPVFSPKSKTKCVAGKDRGSDTRGVEAVNHFHGTPDASIEILGRLRSASPPPLPFPRRRPSPRSPSIAGSVTRSNNWRVKKERRVTRSRHHLRLALRRCIGNFCAQWHVTSAPLSRVMAGILKRAACTTDLRARAPRSREERSSHWWRDPDLGEREKNTHDVYSYSAERVSRLTCAAPASPFFTQYEVLARVITARNRSMKRLVRATLLFLSWLLHVK